MKLAEALLLRADLQKRVEALRTRMLKNTVVQEGEEPSEDPNELLGQVESAIEQLRTLVFAVNEANYRSETAAGRTLTAALSDRDALVSRHAILTAVAASAVKPPDRYGVKEIRWVKTVDVGALQTEADDLARRIREVNAEIQSANWKVDLTVG